MGKFRKGIRRVYGRARRRAAGATLPLIAIPVATAALAPFLMGKNGTISTTDTAVHNLSLGRWNEGAACLGREAIQAKNYIPLVLGVVMWGVAKKLVGKGRITKKLSLL